MFVTEKKQILHFVQDDISLNGVLSWKLFTHACYKKSSSDTSALRAASRLGPAAGIGVCPVITLYQARKYRHGKIRDCREYTGSAFLVSALADRSPARF
jgi:hypothetical protein